jgi:hypothetical protein
MKYIIAILAMLAGCQAHAATVTLQPAGHMCVYLNASTDSQGHQVFHCLTHAPDRPPIVIPPKPVEPPPTPVGCAPSTIQPPIPWGDVVRSYAINGQVKAYPVNSAPPGRSSLSFTQGQISSTPPDAITEYTVSNCPGQMNSGAGACYYRSQFVNNNGITIYTKDIGVAGCILTGPGPHYINVRWSFPSCPFGQCGFSLQWDIGPW